MGYPLPCKAQTFAMNRTKLPKQDRRIEVGDRTPHRGVAIPAVHGGAKQWLLWSRLVLLEKVSFFDDV